MQKDDKIALTIFVIVLAALTIGSLFLARWIFGNVFEFINLNQGGVGWRTAFFSSLPLSFFFILIFALVAGDGLIGELGIMITSFFIMLAFFTVSIALIL